MLSGGKGALPATTDDCQRHRSRSRCMTHTGIISQQTLITAVFEATDRAVSIRRSNIGCEEGFEFFSWGVEAKGCSGAVVEFISDRVEVGLVAGDVGPLG